MKILKEIYWTIKTRKLSPGMNLLEYFCWRIVYSRKLPK